MKTFTRKGHGRIYVEKQAHINIVRGIVAMMDSEEASYMPQDLITTFDNYPQVCYVHKFYELDLDVLTALCWTKGVKIWCLDNGQSEYTREDLSRFQNILDLEFTENGKWKMPVKQIEENLLEIQQTFVWIDYSRDDRLELKLKFERFLETVDVYDVRVEVSSTDGSINTSINFCLDSEPYCFVYAIIQVKR